MRRTRTWLVATLVAAGAVVYLIATQSGLRKEKIGSTPSSPSSKARPTSAAVEREGARPETPEPTPGAGGRIFGTVTDEHGRPLAKAQVIARMGTDPRLFSDSFCGGFGEGFGSDWSDVDESDSDADELKPFGGRCRGGFVEEFAHSRSPEEAFGSGPSETAPAIHDHVETKADGSFITALLKPGTYSVVACGPYHYPSERRTVEVKANTEITCVHFALMEGAAVSGTIVDLDGNPIQGVKIAGAIWTPTGWDFEVNKDGTFLIRGLEPGRHHLELHAEGFLSVARKQNAPAHGVELVLRRGGIFRGYVVDALTGKPIKQFKVHNDKTWSGPKPGRDGRFALTGLAAGNYKITVTAEGYAPRAIEDIRVDEGAETEDVLFELAKGTTLLFAVASAADKCPISSTKINSLGKWPDDEGKQYSGTTADDGTCAFEHVPKGLHQFVVRHDEYADRKLTVNVTEEDQRKEIDVLLDKGLTLHGRVVTSGGQVPIEGAEVRLFEEGHFRASFTTTTNRDGAFSLATVPPGRYTVQARRAGYAFANLERFFDRDFDEKVLIELGLGIRLVVEVSNPDGTPHKAAGVMIFGPDVAGLGDLTDEEGRYVLEDCPPGRYHVRVGEAGKKGMGAFKEVDVPAGKETVLRFALGGGATVFGTISLNGKPMEEMYVYAWPKAVSSERTDYTWGLNCSTDEHGRYNIPGLQPDEYKLEVWVDDFTDAVPGRGGCIVRRDFALGTEDLQFNVELGGDSVMGTVLDDTGTPLQDAAVGIIPIATADDRVEAMFAIRDTYTGRHSTDGLGRFTIMGIGEGTHRLTVGRSGYTNKIVAIEKEAGRDLSNVVIKLEKESILLLRAHGTNGRAPDRIFIAVCDAEGRLLKEEELGAAAETGECRINGLPSGRLTIVAATRNYAPIREEVILQPGKGSILDLDFVPSHELGVTVLDNKGAPLPGAQVLLDPGGDVALADSLAWGALAPAKAREHTDDTGALTFQHVADGDYTVHVLADGYEPVAATVRIAGSDQQITVTLH